MRVTRCVVLVALFASPAITHAEMIKLQPDFDDCPNDRIGIQIAGDADVEDTLLWSSQADDNGCRFQLWCIDDSYYGLRFRCPKLEMWVGLCPYNGGKNLFCVTGENDGNFVPLGVVGLRVRRLEGKRRWRPVPGRGEVYV